MENIPQEKHPVVYTGDIPQCPHCKKPTVRTGGGGAVTAVYYRPTFDEFGHNTNPDRNIRTSYYDCLECKKGYCTKGNPTDGYYYHT